MGILDDMLQQKWQESGFELLRQHVRKFQRTHKYDHVHGGKLPRNYEWRPYRFCVQDVMLGATVVQQDRTDNCLTVDVFLTTDVPEYERGSGAKALAVFLLSEAYKSGGSMEILFTKNVEGGNVPSALLEAARDLGVALEHPRSIVPEEAKELYLALSGFSHQLTERLRNLDKQKVVSIECACYVVHHGVWTRAELESIILGSRYPGSILRGTSMPEQRHLYLQDLLYARAAVLGGFLDRKMNKRESRRVGETALDLEDTQRPLEISFDPGRYAKVYHSDAEQFPLPWLATGETMHKPSMAANHLMAFIRARDTDDLRKNLESDLHSAQQFAAGIRSRESASQIVVLVPHDFLGLSRDEQQHQLELATDSVLGIMICPETVAALDAEASRRMAKSRVLRQW